MTKFTLAPLPYSYDALAPFLSAETLKFHHDKHHQAYVNKLNELLPGSGFEETPLTDIVKKATGTIFNQAGQIWNHDFYWNTLTPKTDQKPEGKLGEAIHSTFGDYEKFKTEFEKAAIGVFGSGWAWLVSDPQTGKLSIVGTSNAENPIRQNQVPLLTCDVWEHAYYIDYRNVRPDYAKKLWSHINWEFAAKNYSHVG